MHSDATDVTRTTPQGKVYKQKHLWGRGESETQTVKDDPALWFIFRHKYFTAPKPLVTEVPSFTVFLVS